MRKLNWIWIVCVLLYFSVIANAQVIKIENGVSISNFRNEGVTLFDSAITPYQATIGIDYLDGEWYNLSSNVGFLRKGGAMTIDNPNEGGTTERHEFKTYLDYLTVNTTFRVKKTASDAYSFYVGVGPRLDVKIHNNSFLEDYVSNEVKYRDIIPGLKCELGVDYMIERYRIGLNFAYLPSFVKPIKESVFRDRTFTVGVVLGYVIN